MVPRSPGDGRGVEEGVRRGGHAAHLPGRRRRGRGRDDPEDAGRPDPGGRHHRHRAGVPRALLLRAAHPDDVRIRRGVRFRPGPVRAGPRAEDGGEGVRRPELGRRGVGPLLLEDARGHARGGQGAQALPVVGGHEPRAALQGDGLPPGSPFHERPPPRPPDGDGERLQQHPAGVPGLPVVRPGAPHGGPSVRAADRGHGDREADVGEDPAGSAPEASRGVPPGGAAASRRDPAPQPGGPRGDGEERPQDPQGAAGGPGAVAEDGGGRLPPGPREDHAGGGVRHREEVPRRVPRRAARGKGGVR